MLQIWRSPSRFDKGMHTGEGVKLSGKGRKSASSSSNSTGRQAIREKCARCHACASTFIFLLAVLILYIRTDLKKADIRYLCFSAC